MLKKWEMKFWVVYSILHFRHSSNMPGSALLSIKPNLYVLLKTTNLIIRVSFQTMGVLDKGKVYISHVLYCSAKQFVFFFDMQYKTLHYNNLLLHPTSLPLHSCPLFPSHDDVHFFPH